MRPPHGLDHAALGRKLLGVALLGFGAENILFFAGVALIAAGLGLWTPPVRRVAATLAAAMVFSWVFLVHIPLVATVGRAEWMGVFEALGISGVCLALARWPERNVVESHLGRTPSRAGSVDDAIA
jgi:hypothetical protein